MRFQVKATADSEPLAAFQYHEWADNWRYQYCRTGVIVEVGPPLPTIEDIQGIYHEGDTTHRMVEVQVDGGEPRLVHETEAPDYPRDGG